MVTSHAAGRVRIDFNNPLAGKTVKYVFKVTKKAATPEDRIRAILDMDYGLAEQFKISLRDDALEVQLPDLCKTDEKWFVSKFRVVADLRELTDVHVMRFVEEYEKKVEAPKEAKAGEKPAESPEGAEKPKEPAPKAAPKKARQPKKPPAPKRSEEELPKEEKAPEEL